jgi:hypothetical protein
VVGRRGRLVAQGETQKRTQVRSNGQIEKDERDNTRVLFEAVERVVSVDGDGRALQSEYTIARLEREDDGGKNALLSAGQVLTVVRDAQEGQLTVDGQAVAAPVRSALDVVLSLTTGGANDDEIFGTTQRRAPGAEWPIRGDLAARDLAKRLGVQATISGSTHLVQRTTFQDTDCLKLTADMSGTFGAFPKLPPGMLLRTGTFNAGFEAMQPIDTSIPNLSNTTRMRIHVVADLPMGSQTKQIDMAIAVQRRESFTPL